MVGVGECPRREEGEAWGGPGLGWGWWAWSIWLGATLGTVVRARRPAVGGERVTGEQADLFSCSIRFDEERQVAVEVEGWVVFFHNFFRIT